MKIKWELVVLYMDEPNMFLNPYPDCSITVCSDIKHICVGSTFLYGITYRKIFNIFKKFNILKKKLDLKEYELYKSKAWKNVKTAEV